MAERRSRGSADIGAKTSDWINIVRRARLGFTATGVALMIASYADADGTHVYPGVARIAVQCELAHSTVRAALARLRNAGLIEVTRRGNRRRGQSDEYRLIFAIDLLDRLDVPTPEQERKSIEELREQVYRYPGSANNAISAI